jgi:hypothetical protein
VVELESLIPAGQSDFAPHPAGFALGALNGTSCVLARCTAVGAWSGGPIFVATLAMAN